MTDLRPYGAYRESGYEWLGHIPDHWIVNRTSRLFKVAMGQTILKEDLSTSGAWPVFSATEGDHYFGRIDNPQVRLRPGDLVIPARGNSIGNVKLVHEPATSTQTTIYCQRIEPSPLSPEFSFYYMSGSRKYLFDFTQTAIPQITVAEVGQNPIVVPPMVEQSRITRFLDRETAQIDDLIGKQERLIELLAEKRRAIITHAVTKGLDSTAPTKPSGSLWLGAIPTHWIHGQIKQTALKITDGAHVSPETENGEFDFVSTKDLGASGIDFNGALKTSCESYRYMVSAGCRPQVGDVLFSKDGTIGKTVVVHEDREFVVASSLIIIRPDRKIIEDKFLDFACQSKPVQAQVVSYAKGAGLPRLSIANLRRVQLPLPPLEEQIRITEHLTAETSAIDHLTERSEEAIQLLSERRSALISAAITGKIDVREGAA